MPNPTLTKETNFENYFYGQGKIFISELDENNKPKDWRWLLDVSAFSLTLEVEKVTHNESWSGAEGVAKEITTTKSLGYSATLHSLNPDNLALGLLGVATVHDAGTVTGEELPQVAEGSRVTLSYLGVSNVVISDAGGTAIDEALYTVDPDYGSIVFKALPATPPTQPFTVAYSYKKNVHVTTFDAPQKPVALRYEGINIAESNEPFVFEIYKTVTAPLSELALIQNEQALAGMQITGSSQIAEWMQQGGKFGQFGRSMLLPRA